MAQGGNISLLAPCLDPWNDLPDQLLRVTRPPIAGSEKLSFPVST
jgi:hypothetical protein